MYSRNQIEHNSPPQTVKIAQFRGKTGGPCAPCVLFRVFVLNAGSLHAMGISLEEWLHANDKRVGKEVGVFPKLQIPRKSTPILETTIGVFFNGQDCLERDRLPVMMKAGKFSQR